MQKHGRDARVEGGRHLPGQDAAREVVDEGVQVGATAIEQSNRSRVDVPDLVGSGGADADFRTRGMKALAGPPPLEAAEESIPGRGRGENLTQALGQQGQRARRYVPLLLRCHHLLDGRALAGSELMGR